jgi:hypothetical protein
LNYVRPLQEAAGAAIVAERAYGLYRSVDELRRRVPRCIATRSRNWQALAH